MGERFVVSGSRVAEALAELGPAPSSDEIAEALVELVEREQVLYRLEVEWAEADALVELGERIDRLAESIEADRKAQADAEAARILDRAARRR